MKRRTRSPQDVGTLADRWMQLSSDGLSNQTTRGYLFLGPFMENEADDTEIFLYFILDGLGLAYRLHSEMGHLFSAASFSHQTSVCVAVSGNMVYYHGGRGRVFAWGKAGEKDS